MHHTHSCRQRRRVSNSFSTLLILGAVSLIVALQCEATAFIAQLTTRTKFPSKPPRQYGHGSTRATSLQTPLFMVAKSGGRLIVSTEQFEQEVLFSETESNKNNDPGDDKALALPVLVLFTAPWCGPCRLTSPVVKEVMKQYQDKIEVVEISTDDLPEVASKAGVLSIPTILMYHRGEVMDTIVGCVAKNVLARSVDKVLEDLGMLGREEV